MTIELEQNNVRIRLPVIKVNCALHDVILPTFHFLLLAFCHQTSLTIVCR